MVAKNPKRTLEYLYPFILVVTSALALLASVMIMHEGIAALKNPNYIAVCDINPIFSCGSVMDSPQSRALGFDNTYSGVIGFSAVVTIGVTLLAGARYAAWFWRALLGGMTAAQVFILWLIHQSLYEIGSLCLFCMLLWITVTAAFWYTFVYVLRKQYVTVPRRLQATEAFIQRHHLDILIAFYLVVTALILHRFWYYFGSIL